MDPERAAARPEPTCEEEAVRLLAPMVRSLAGRLARDGSDLDDLLQVGNLALVKAFRGFDRARGPFAPYAYASISGELKRYLRDHCWTVRPPRRVQELHTHLKHAAAEVSQISGRTPSARELAVAVGATAAETAEALCARACMAPASLDQAAGDSSRSLAEVVPDEAADLDDVENAIALEQICRNLTASERELLRLRFYEDLSQRQIAARLGISQMQVSRRLTAVLSSLRQVATAA